MRKLIYLLVLPSLCLAEDKTVTKLEELYQAESQLRIEQNSVARKAFTDTDVILEKSYKRFQDLWKLSQQLAEDNRRLKAILQEREAGQETSVTRRPVERISQPQPEKVIKGQVTERPIKEWFN